MATLPTYPQAISHATIHKQNHWAYEHRAWTQSGACRGSHWRPNSHPNLRLLSDHVYYQNNLPKSARYRSTWAQSLLSAHCYVGCSNEKRNSEGMWKQLHRMVVPVIIDCCSGYHRLLFRLASNHCSGYHRIIVPVTIEWLKMYTLYITNQRL